MMMNYQLFCEPIDELWRDVSLNVKCGPIYVDYMSHT